jgi:hypothetical protein
MTSNLNHSMHQEHYDLSQGYIIVTGFFNGHKVHRVLMNGDVKESFIAGVFVFSIFVNIETFKTKGLGCF